MPHNLDVSKLASRAFLGNIRFFEQCAIFRCGNIKFFLIILIYQRLMSSILDSFKIPQFWREKPWEILPSITYYTAELLLQKFFKRFLFTKIKKGVYWKFQQFHWILHRFCYTLVVKEIQNRAVWLKTFIGKYSVFDKKRHWTNACFFSILFIWKENSWKSCAKLKGNEFFLMASKEWYRRTVYCCVRVPDMSCLILCIRSHDSSSAHLGFFINCTAGNIDVE